MNFGIIGLGHIANKFAETINYLNECLYAVASRDIEKARDFKNKYNSYKFYGSYEELFNDPNIDIIYLATPNRYHYIYAKEALNHLKNVICEKPFTINPYEAEELYSLAKSKNLFIMEALWPMFFPATKKLKEIINSGLIGDIKNIKVTYGSYKAPLVKKRLCDNSLGGGALLDIGIYPLSFIDSILDKEVDSYQTKYELSEYNTDQYSEIHLNYKDGITADVLITFKEELQKEAYIIGTKGYIYIPNHHHNESFIVKTNEEINYSFPFEFNGFEYQIKEAIEMIKNKKVESVSYPAKRSIRMMKLLYDIRLSFGVKYSFE